MRPRFTVCILTGAVLLWLGIVPTNAQQDPGGCGPIDAKHKTTIHTDKRPTPNPAPGKVLIYFVRSASTRRAFVQMKLAANGRWIGVLPRGNYYAFAEIEPGVVRLCGNLGNSPEPHPNGFVFLTAVAGKSYYFEAKLASTGVGLAEVDETRGTALLAESRFVTFEEKR